MWVLDIRCGYSHAGMSRGTVDPNPCLSNVELTCCQSWLHLPGAVTDNGNRFGDRSFAVAGPRLWNSLPTSLRQISSYGQFRRYLKKSFIKMGFEKSQRSVTHDSLRYINILTYLITSLLISTTCDIITSKYRNCKLLFTRQ